jgi:hypothetical protein
MLQRIEVEYEVTGRTPPSVLAVLEGRLGARAGDSVRVYSSGRVELVRVASGEDELDLVACLSDGRCPTARAG